MPTPSPEVLSRIDLGNLANRCGVRAAVEVGCDLGIYSCQFLSRFGGEVLLCVDPYLPYNEAPYNRDGDYMTALMALMEHHGRARIIREPSPAAAKRMPTYLKIGLVYIDGDHDLEAVRADLAAWWEVLTPGGIFAGHDYDPSHPGVISAVDEFAAAHDLQVFITHELDFPRSWYCFKP